MHIYQVVWLRKLFHANETAAAAQQHPTITKGVSVLIL
jgi:hypothetical protein